MADCEFCRHRRERSWRCRTRADAEYARRKLTAGATKNRMEQHTNLTDKSPSRYRNHVAATSEEHHQEHHEHGTSERCIEWLLVRQEQELAALADRKRDGGNLRGDVIGDGINLRGGEQRPEAGHRRFPVADHGDHELAIMLGLQRGSRMETTP